MSHRAPERKDLPQISRKARIRVGVITMLTGLGLVLLPLAGVTIWLIVPGIVLIAFGLAVQRN